MRFSFLPSLVMLIKLVSISSLPAQSPSEDAASKLKEVVAKFQTAYDRDVTAPHTQALSDLDTKYLGAVNRALEGATQAGDLDSALKLREEAQRVTAKGALPPVDLESLPGSLKQLRLTYRGALEKLDRDRDLKAQPYFEHYEKLLEALQADLTKQNRIDDALAVKAKRDAVALDRPKVAAVVAAESPEALPAKASKGAGATSAGAVVLKGSAWRNAAEWVLSLRGELEVEDNGRRQTVKDLDALPAGKFNIIRISFSRYEKHDGLKMNEVDLTLLNPFLRTLEKLDLDDCNLTGEGLEAIAGAPNLRSLSLHHCPLTDDSLRHLSALPNLTTLHLSTAAMTGSGLMHLRGLTKLRNLSFANSAFNDAPGKTFSEAGSQALGTLTQVEVFQAQQGNLGDPQVKFTEGVGKLINLRRLILGDNSAVSDTDLVALSGLMKLESASFSNSRVSGTGVAHLKGSAATLKQLNLFYQCPVTDDAINIIVASLPNLSIGYGATCGRNSLTTLAALKKLRILTWCSKTPFTDADPAQFALLPSLERLSIYDTPMTDVGMAGIALCKHLTSFAISNTPITDAALPHLKGLKSLRKLQCGKSTQVTDAGLADFKKMRPDVEVGR